MRARTKKGRCFQVTLAITPVVIWLLFLSGGAFVFSRIEGPYLAQLRADEREFFAQLVYQAWERGRLCNETNLTIQEMANQNDTDCQLDDIVALIVRDLHQDKGLEWNFIGGFHFCLTVVSTIGYGILVPKTRVGRILCVFYAIIGIPLNITLIGWVGRGIVFGVTKTYQSLRNACMSCRKKQGKRIDVRPPRRSFSSFSIVGAARINSSRMDVYPESSETPSEIDHRQTQNLNGQGESAIPNGTIVAGNGDGKDSEGKVKGRTMSKSHSIGNALRVAYTSSGGIAHKDNAIVKVEDDGPVIDQSDGDEDNNNNDNKDNSRTSKEKANDGVPIWFVALFFILYLCLTTMLIYFSDFVPEEWSLIDSFYFDIVTILTVGFGDMFYYSRGQTLTEQQKTSGVLVSIATMILGMLMLSSFLSFAVESFTLTNIKKFFDSVFAHFFERFFCRKRKRKRSHPGR